MAPFRCCWLTDCILIAEHPNLLHRLGQRDRLEPLNRHKIFRGVWIVSACPMIGCRLQHIQSGLLALWGLQLKVGSADRLALHPADANEPESRRLHPYAVANRQKIERVGIPCSATGRDEAIARGLLPRTGRAVAE
jgi:hypothetical protein